MFIIAFLERIFKKSDKILIIRKKLLFFDKNVLTKKKRYAIMLLVKLQNGRGGEIYVDKKSFFDALAHTGDSLCGDLDSA